jgi:uncharacterized protein (TIGR03086 family)
MSAPRRLIEAAAEEFERVVRLLPDDSWALTTPMDVTVREVVEHVVAGNRLTTLLLSGVDRADAMARVSDEQLGDDPLAAVRESAAGQAEAFARTPLDRPVPGPRGPRIPASAFLRFRLVDLVVHAWDLVRGAGLDETLDSDVVERLWAVVEPHLDEMLAFGAYGDGPSDPPPQTSTQDRLLDAFGRRP